MAQGKLRKDAGIVGLLFAGVSTMIGSGWLFGPMHARQDAGPLSIGSWAIAALVVGLIAVGLRGTRVRCSRAAVA